MSGQEAIPVVDSRCYSREGNMENLMHGEFTAIYECDGDWYVAYCPEVLPFVSTSISENGQRRMVLLDRLCADESKLDFSLQGMLTLFSIHEKPVGICQHGPELHSNDGFFMLPRKKEVLIVRGYTCERDSERVTFNSLPGK